MTKKVKLNIKCSICKNRFISNNYGGTRRCPKCKKKFLVKNTILKELEREVFC